MPYTLVEAAQATGVNRSTILRAIKAGRISATRDEATQAWLVEPVELHRIFAPVQCPSADGQDAQARTTDIDPSEIRELRVRLEAALEAKRVQAETIDDLRQRLDTSEAMRQKADEERRQAQTQLTALLTDQRAPTRRPWRFWRR